MGNKNATATILIDASLLCLITLFAAFNIVFVER